jgi:hypothetical protein
MITQNEYWIQEYRNYRYLEHLSDIDLEDRLKHMIENLLILTPSGKIGLGDLNQYPWNIFIRKFAHTKTEFNIRNSSPHHDFLNSSSIPRPDAYNSKQFKNISEIVNGSNPELIKFGKYEFLSDYSLKISLAKSFDDPSLNLAQMDDEMKLVFKVGPTEVSAKDSKGNVLELIGPAEIKLNLEREYYVFCCSHSFDIRMFDNFEADSCLLIYDYKRFISDIVSKLREKIEIKDSGCDYVTYIDPVQPDIKTDEIEIEFCKNLKYQYQNEFRYVFIPEDGQDLPNDIIINLWEASEYTKVVRL